jgi:hypothetical protein
MTNQPPPEQDRPYEQPAYPPSGQPPQQQQYWAPQPPPKKKHTARNVLIGVGLAFVVLFGGCAVLVGVGLNEAAEDIEDDANKPGGTDNPMTIEEGEAFEVDGFEYADGWQLARDGLGDATVKGLKVTNRREDKDSALVEIKLWRGNEVVTLIDCTTSPMDVGSKVKLNCVSTDQLPRGFTKITINDTF